MLPQCQGFLLPRSPAPVGPTMSRPCAESLCTTSSYPPSEMGSAIPLVLLVWKPDSETVADWPRRTTRKLNPGLLKQRSVLFTLPAH